MGSYAQQKERITIPYGFTPAQRIEIGNEIIKFIIKRTQRHNRDEDDNAFAQYSPEYEDEKNSARVNLTASGDMLDNLKVLKTYVNYVTIGYEADYDGMGKVLGNRIGSYGKKNGVKSRERDFLGITDEDLKVILSKFEKPSDRLSEVQSVVQKEAFSLNNRQLQALGFGLGIGDKEDNLKLDQEGKAQAREMTSEDFDKLFK